MRLTDFTCSNVSNCGVGNQDRSLSADAVIFPASITIIKDATPNGSTSFPFTGSPSPLTNFSLVDDGTSANTKVFSNITNFQTYTVNETPIPLGWGFDSVSCSVTTPNGGSYTTSTTTVNIVMKEGENWTCTYLDSLREGTLTVIKHVVNDNGGSATADQWSIHVKSGASEVSGSPQPGSESGTSYTLTGGTYNVSETGGPSAYTFTGFSGDCDSSGNVTVVAGQSKTCTLTNNDQTAHLKLVKTVTNNNGGTAVATDFTLSAAGPTPISGAGGAESDVNAGTYNLSETSVTGYTAGNWSCVGGTQNGASVTLALGQSATCTITNDDQAATLHVVKVVVNDNGGTKTASDFSFSVNGGAAVSFEAGGQNDLTVDAGTYSVTEPAVSGYTTTYDNCSNVVIPNGDEATCTITNNDVAPTLTVMKIVVNDDGGNAVVSDFPLFINGNSVTSGVPNTLSANTLYTASETTLAGYTPSVWGGDCAPDGTITLNEGDNKTCTITNNDVAPTLKLVKVVTNDDGGNAVADDWTLSADAAAPFDGRNFSNLGGSGVFDTVFANTGYDLSESSVAGYTAGSWSCDGGTLVGSTITLDEGQTGVTCTITNNDVAPTLTLIKNVINDNGGKAGPNDFGLSIGGNAATSGVAYTLNANTAYVVNEAGLSGYTFVSITGDPECPAVLGGTVTLDEGEDVTCTITNNDDVPSLTLVKVVVNNNGGTAVAANFTLSANGPTPISGIGGATSDASFDAGTYDLSETSVPGYSASDWVCVGGTQDDSDTVTVGLGENVTCTITNDDDAPSLTLVKLVVNNDGGTALVSDWTLTASGPTGFSGPGGSVPNGASFDAGTYDLSESGPSGYSASAWVCVGGTQNDADTITLGLGESAICTITNNDVAPTLKLVKTVTNNNGGNAGADDWTLSAVAADPNDGRNFSNAGGSGVFETVFANTGYDLSESTVAGYIAGSWSCDGGTQVGSTITLAAGQTGVTCTITNDDVAPKLTLVKVVINDNDGNAGANDFGLSVGGAPVNSGDTTTLDANAAYAINEAGLSGYTFVSITGDAKCPAVLGGTVTLDEGDDITCTITNDDDAPSLTLVKVVVNDNGGTAVESAWTLTAAGPTGFSGAGPSVSNGASFDAGSYDLSESGPAGYSASAWVCVGGTQDDGDTITVGLGESATCTITNNDIAPQLIVIKHVVNDSGGTNEADDFTMTVDDPDTDPPSFDGAEAPGTTVTVDPGNYVVYEDGLSGYVASFSAGCAGSIGIGETKTCTITNDDQPGTIIVIKNAKPASGSFTFTTTGTDYNGFTLSGDPTNDGNKNTQTLDAGTYTVQESTQLGWILTGIGGSSDPNTPYDCTVTGSGGSTGVGDLNTQTATINLKNGDTVTCVFENTGQGVTRTQGFWATHTPLANIAWFGGTAFGHTFPGVASVSGIGDNLICGRPVDDLGKLMGGFWSDISKKSTGAKRTSLDQARMQLLQQLLAAELNASAFGSVPSVGSFAAWEGALCGTSTNAIKTAQQQAASFNSSGDSSQFTPGTSADSKNARAIATYAFWDVLP
jgi:hypothetical protein